VLVGLRHNLERDAVGAPAVSLDDMLGALDRGVRSEYGAEGVEFGPAEALAGRRGHADRAVILNEEEAISP